MVSTEITFILLRTEILSSLGSWKFDKGFSMLVGFIVVLTQILILGNFRLGIFIFPLHLERLIYEVKIIIVIALFFLVNYRISKFIERIK